MRKYSRGMRRDRREQPDLFDSLMDKHAATQAAARIDANGSGLPGR
jgi:hypothetical protein